MALIDNLVSYWKLDEASGNAVDAHGANTLTDENTVGTAAGKINGARDFESGSIERFILADNADLSVGDIGFSWSLWVQLESKGADRSILSKWYSASNNREYWLLFANASDRFQFAVSSNGTAEAWASADNLGSPSLATWYHIVVWHDPAGDVIGITVNDGTPNTTAHTTGVVNGGSTFALGLWKDAASSNFAPFDGLIDEVGFWKKVLSSGEITQLYNGGSGLAYPFTGGGGIIQQAMHYYQHLNG
jgi:hypothetical protein